MPEKIIGRVTATSSSPTTMDKFTFWTNANTPLHVFDIVKVEHLGGSITFGSVEAISHITDSNSVMTDYISNDFGSLNTKSPTSRVQMNYVEASVLLNTKNFYTPVHNNAPVYTVSPDEVKTALGLDKIQNPLTCGYITMYDGTTSKITLPVTLNSKFVLGPDGAHLNISGISGLAAKTSYSMFLLKAIQEQSNENIAFVIFNVKGRDLMAIDQPNTQLTSKERKRYTDIGLSAEPFTNVHYYIPCKNDFESSSYLSGDDIKSYISQGKLKGYSYSYEDDRENLELLFADIDDSSQTIAAIISKIIDSQDSDFNEKKGVNSWETLLDRIHEFTKVKAKQRIHPEDDSINIFSWRMFYRLINTQLKNDRMFTSNPREKFE